MARDGRPMSELEMQRRVMGFTQTSLSRVIHKLTGEEISQWRISMLERGVWANAKERELLASVLDCSPSYIFPSDKYPDPARDHLEA